MIDPSLPEVKRKRASLEATAEVTENRWPRVRSVGGAVKCQTTKDEGPHICNYK
jgi:hypothetical protein